MIYVTVGSHDQPFDRLIREMDRISGEFGIETVIQTGCSGVRPKNAEWRDYFPFDKAEELIRKAEVVVGHAGIGTVISARKAKRPLIVVPRLKKFGEHFNDHQLEISRELISNPRPGVEVALETAGIETILANILENGVSISESGSEPGAGIKAEIKTYLESL
jgi:UDP-N-acetylglucosamine transferase subunit ALG13